MDALLIVRVTSIIAIAAAYMLFDIFNKRNVPSVFVYATLAYGALLTMTYALSADYYTAAFSLLAAAVVFGLGYATYRAGQLGLGDVAELATISLAMPLFNTPLLASAPQLGLPFVLSVVIASGVAALVFVPIYYIPRSGMKGISKKSARKAAVISAAYLAFIAFTALTGVFNIYGIALIAALMFGSFFTILCEEAITGSMVKYLAVPKLEPEDMLALNMLSRAEISWFKGQARHFGQLVTPIMINELRAGRVKRKLPVYRQGIPFALPIFIGTVVSLLLGNLLLLAL